MIKKPFRAFRGLFVKKPTVSLRVETGLFYSIDICKYKKSTLTLYGWLFLPKRDISQFSLILTHGDLFYQVPVGYGIYRPDVYRTHQGYIKTAYVGFHFDVFIETPLDFSIQLKFTDEVKNIHSLPIGAVKQPYIKRLAFYARKYKMRDLIKDIPLLLKREAGQIARRFRHISVQSIMHPPPMFLSEFLSEFTVKETHFGLPRTYSGIIDIILPVYNGYDYLGPLLESIQQTKWHYRLIIIDDCSTDTRIKPFLRNTASEQPAIALIENDENQGFVKSVNKALALSNHHVVLLNSDVELPDEWLERLMYPIVFGEKVASATPFTNSGTICGFPQMGDNPLFKGLPLKQIDVAFKRVKPFFYSVPTGVGFCMGMNGDALREIGLLDAEAFGKGYGEENDWCQRAIHAGYRNVMVENLFVYHKHGGSFSGEEKEALIKRNTAILIKRYPQYNNDVRFYINIDPAKMIREYAVMWLLHNIAADRRVLFFDHGWGGGATIYLNRRVDEELGQNSAVIILRYDKKRQQYFFQLQHGNYVYKHRIHGISDVLGIMGHFLCEEIYVNELVTYPNLYKWLPLIVTLKKAMNGRMVYLLHDYFCICPSVQLLDNNCKYCGLPAKDICGRCFKKSKFHQEYKNMGVWRNHWNTFFQSCDEIVTFSESSRKLWESVYGPNPILTVIPHKVNYISKLKRTTKINKNLIVGLLGSIGVHKGSEIIQDMLCIIAQKKLSIRFVLIGCSYGNIKPSPYLTETGLYRPEDIEGLTIKHNIDLFFISSIWPETFSYTAEEVMCMDMPLVCFNLGAPAERVSRYSKGLLINKINAASALDALLGHKPK
jgi:GT2 family glycosyltransferase